MTLLRGQARLEESGDLVQTRGDLGRLVLGHVPQDPRQVAPVEVMELHGSSHVDGDRRADGPTLSGGL